MEGRPRKYRPATAERVMITKVRSEPLISRQKQNHHHHHYHHRHLQHQQQQQERKIPVVYYLCRNNHLEHPHFVEVPISASEGPYLRDVINRLNALRGEKMAAMYSWSCKRSYKNGFVWHDLSVDDLVLPATKNEYVLKGTEILGPSLKDGRHQSIINGNLRMQNLKQQKQIQEATFTLRSQETSPSSSCMAVAEDDELSPIMCKEISCFDISPDEKIHPSWENGNMTSIVGCNLYKSSKVTDASTQTEEPIEGQKKGKKFGIDGPLNPRFDERNQRHTALLPKSRKTDKYEVLDQQLGSSSTSSSDENMETLESLIKADIREMSNLKKLHDEGFIPTKVKVKATDVIMQLITCGSLSQKDHHDFEIDPAYKQQISNLKLQSPLFNNTTMSSELDSLSENGRRVGLRLNDKKFFSGSLIETKKHRKEGAIKLKRSSSYNAERNRRTQVAITDAENDEKTLHVRPNCLPNGGKVAFGKQSRNETTRARISVSPRMSSDSLGYSLSPSIHKLNESMVRRSADGISWKGSVMRPTAFKEENGIKIEERLTSGARITIQASAAE